MAHHSGNPFPADSELAKIFGAPRRTFGATGCFPEGKLTSGDEGEIQIGIAQNDGTVVIDFGQPVAWIGFPPEQADDIAASLKKFAREARASR